MVVENIVPAAIKIADKASESVSLGKHSISMKMLETNLLEGRISQ